MQVTCVLKGPMFNLLFYCRIISYWEKVTFSEKFSRNLTLEVQIVWKMPAFSCSRWKPQNAEQRAAWRKFLSLPSSTHSPPDKISLRLWNKAFLTEIYRNIKEFIYFKSTSRNAVLGHPEMGQCKCFSWHQREIHAAQVLRRETPRWPPRSINLLKLPPRFQIMSPRPINE